MKPLKQSSTVRRYALTDMVKYYESLGQEPGVYIVDTKESRQLNRELGIHSVNYCGNTNNINN
jgi:hypothetical protein